MHSLIVAFDKYLVVNIRVSAVFALCFKLLSVELSQLTR